MIWPSSASCASPTTPTCSVMRCMSTWCSRATTTYLPGHCQACRTRSSGSAVQGRHSHSQLGRCGGQWGEGGGEAAPTAVSCSLLTSGRVQGAKGLSGVGCADLFALTFYINHYAHLPIKYAHLPLIHKIMVHIWPGQTVRTDEEVGVMQAYA
jgi:hypothetical protein